MLLGSKLWENSLGKELMVVVVVGGGLIFRLVLHFSFAHF